VDCREEEREEQRWVYISLGCRSTAVHIMVELFLFGEAEKYSIMITFGCFGTLKGGERTRPYVALKILLFPEDRRAAHSIP
jgi:hypothetical protein